jgi:putative membrane protein
MSALIALILLAWGGSAVWAHGTEHHHDLAPSWTFDPWIVTPLLVAATLYGAGLWRILRRAGESRAVILKGVLFYSVGWATLALALMSPLHWLGERLFTFHMIEHEIVMAISAPMMVAARPVAVLMWGLPHRIRLLIARMMQSAQARTAWGWISHGTTATTLHGVAIWAWHAPVLFDAAVTDVVLHRLQHFSFFVTAVLFWWSVLWRSNRGVAAWHLFITMLHTGILGALMALAPNVLYVAQTRAAATWGMTPLEDQQLAGIVMWIPAGIVYAGAALTLLALWISESGKGGRDIEPLRP